MHGTLMTADDMSLGPVPTLSRDFRCIAFDRPGHGWSDHRRGADASLWSQLATIRDAVRALGLVRPVICGHSFGGALALAYGLAHPDEVSGIVALAPICFAEPRLEQMLFGVRVPPVWGDALSTVLGATLDPICLPALWRAMFLPQMMPKRFVDGFPFARAGRAEQIVADAENAVASWPDLVRSALLYHSCTAPVHILCGGADMVVSAVTQGMTASAMIPGARYTLLPGVGHMLHHVRTDAIESAIQQMAAQRH